MAFVVILDNNKWYLVRFESDYRSLASLSYEELTAKTLEWLVEITGTSILVDLFGDEEDKSDLSQIIGSKTEQAEPRWTTIKRWSGKGNRQTESFGVTNHEWQLEWAAKNEDVFGVLIVTLYRENGNIMSMPINQMGEGAGSTYVRGAGKYYLDINSANVDWEIKVLDYR